MARHLLPGRSAGRPLARILRALLPGGGGRLDLLQRAVGNDGARAGSRARRRRFASPANCRARSPTPAGCAIAARSSTPSCARSSRSRRKLQVILVQLPPSFAPKDGRAALRSFLEQLPRDFRFAIEFRHPGWHRPQIVRLLQKHRVCWVWADTSPLNERNLAPFELWPNTTDFLYVRLLGDYSTKYAQRRRAPAPIRQAALETRSGAGKLGAEDRAPSRGDAQRLGVREQSLRRLRARDLPAPRATARLRTAAAHALPTRSPPIPASSSFSRRRRDSA